MVWRCWPLAGAPDWWQFPTILSALTGRAARCTLAPHLTSQCWPRTAWASAYQYINAAKRFTSTVSPSLPLETSDISIAIPCPRLPIQLSHLPPSTLFSMLPWRSTLSKLGKISATTHSPPRLIIARILILFLIFLKNKPRRLTNSRMAMSICLGGLHPSSTCYMPSLPTKPLETALVTLVPQRPYYSFHILELSIPQVFPLANAVFCGIGILLSVSSSLLISTSYFVTFGATRKRNM